MALSAIIYFLISVCILALIVYVVFWVLETIGVPIPPQIKNIVWVIVALLVLLWLVDLLTGGAHMPQLMR